mmetsp:Transcript_88/g.151  ORF Transcript_88/g.151 Transcript_88/m.151 type:complete len:245 (+) Transcript_88:22-756(+)
MFTIVYYRYKAFAHTACTVHVGLLVWRWYFANVGCSCNLPAALSVYTFDVSAKHHAPTNTAIKFTTQNPYAINAADISTEMTITTVAAASIETRHIARKLTSTRDASSGYAGTNKLKQNSKICIQHASRHSTGKKPSTVAIKSTLPLVAYNISAQNASMGACVRGPATATNKSPFALASSVLMYASPPSGQSKICDTLPPTIFAAVQCPSSWIKTVFRSTKLSKIPKPNRSQPKMPYASVVSAK